MATEERPVGAGRDESFATIAIVRAPVQPAANPQNDGSRSHAPKLAALLVARCVSFSRVRRRFELEKDASSAGTLTRMSEPALRSVRMPIDPQSFDDWGSGPTTGTRAAAIRALPAGGGKLGGSAQAWL